MQKLSQYVVAALIGAVAALVIGYFAYALHGGLDGSRSFTAWIFHPNRADAFYWFAAGLLCGAGARYAFR